MNVRWLAGNKGWLKGFPEPAAACAAELLQLDGAEAPGAGRGAYVLGGGLREQGEEIRSAARARETLAGGASQVAGVVRGALPGLSQRPFLIFIIMICIINHNDHSSFIIAIICHLN